ncbi:DNA-binding transcriptional regulator, MocR family, contains an aminotransferase domain [Cupriavidus sp. YR651]|uniref:MocR-like B6 salvage transcription factor PtsJ n=1 Tax=Cupriavidus sp. YR651 TaxID=1855315 RepID=UPI0008867593|nr:transcriptional regulator PtsJ [Cupriavidus sp. YR651]SDC85365.1 DNA-binding transcriptional regulator, MocR family, contains an aminotransferase domain [Cupriavidus sp. YR651]
MTITGKSAAEIFDSIRLQVQTGKLPPGAALPPVRDLAAALEVNRNTVAAAYKRLTATGLARAQGRLGTTIADQNAPGEQEGQNFDSPLADLASGNPNPDWLPDPTRLLARDDYRPRLYGEPTVSDALEALARRWFDSDCPAGYRIDMTHGAVDAIERLVAVHLVTGDGVAVEDPCFLGTINALRLAGMHAIGVETDAEGMRPESLERVLSAGAQAVLITPRAQNPTGCSLSAARADALRAVLAKFPNVLAIADDHFALLADAPYASVIPASTWRWALIRSMSKALGPDLRVAFVASDTATSDRLRARLAPGMTWVSHLLQDIVGACLTSPEVATIIGEAKAQYTRRRNELADALRSRNIPVPPLADGFNVWLPVEMDATALAHSLARRGWLVRSAQAFAVHTPIHAIRITVSALKDGEADRLAADVRRCLDGG